MRSKKRIVYKSVYKCDRCGKEYNCIEGTLKLNRAILSYSRLRTLYEVIRCDRIKHTYDLCTSCARKVDKFIEEGRDQCL